MQGFFMRWLIHTVSLIVVVQVVPGIYVDQQEVVLVAALILGLLNAFLRPILIMLTFPIFVFSLGLFTFVINSFILYLVSKVVAGFYIENFASALLGSLLFSLVSFFLNLYLGPRRPHVKSSARASEFKKESDNSRVIDVQAKVKDDDEKS